MSRTKSPHGRGAGQDSGAERAQEREERIQRLLEQYERLLREQMPEDGAPQTLEQIEETAERVGEAVKERVQREVTEQQGSGFLGARCRCPHCGKAGQARPAGTYSRRLVTRHGPLRVKRAYYHCRACSKGFCPLDRHLGIGSGQLSASVVALLCRFASYLSFREAARELEIVCGVRLSVSTIARYAGAVGQQLQREAATHQERVQRALERGDAAAVFAGRPPQRMQVSMDGVLIHAGGAWREAKLGCVYQPDPKSGAQEARYVATLADSATFGRRLHALSVRAGAHECSQVAVVADGAEWIWQESGKYFARREQILDFYHASEHLWNVARAWFGERTTEQKAAVGAWVQCQRERLWDGEAAQIIAAITVWQPETAEQRDLRRRELGYFQERLSRARLRYPAFRAQGFHIGSGVIEAGCKAVVQARLKGVGMRWSAAGAEAMLHLRAAWCSQGQADFSDPARQTVRNA